MIEAVAIDFDDTLCLTEALFFDIENEILLQMGRPAMSREIHKQTWGMKTHQAIGIRSPGIDIEEFKKVFTPVFENHLQAGKIDRISEENYQALDSLIEMGKKLIILTSRSTAEAKHLLAPDHLLADKIKLFYHEDNTQYHKPDPRAFDGMLNDTGLLPSQCVYVGDAITDAQAANGAGLHFVACLEGGIRQRSDFRDVPVDIFIDRFADIVDAVVRLDARA